MSYSIYLVIDTGDVEPASVCTVGDHTSNVSPMWTAALGFALAELDGATAGHVVGTIREAVRRIDDDRGRFEEMAPANGYGTVDSARDYLDKLARCCTRHPRAQIRMYR